MAAPETFLDTNVLLYLLADGAKADRAEEILSAGGVVSVQVLNELTSVALRKLKLAVPEVREIVDAVKATCTVVPLTEAEHAAGLDLVERHGFAFYDATIVAAALHAGCTTLLSEDMQHGQRVERQLTIRNPF